VQSQQFSLAAGAGVRYANVLDSVFGLDPDQVGALAVEASGPELLAMSRTYNLPSAKVAGTFGQELPGIPADMLIASGVKYDELTDTATNVRDAAVVPLAVMAVLLLLVTTILGWWRPVLRDHVGAPRIWRWIAMLWVVAIVVGLDYSRIAKLDSSFILWAAVAGVLVGFSEETAYRGLAVTAFRSGYGENRVWLFSTLLFMYLHAFNFVAGQDLGPTLFQLVFTFVMGSVLYAIRRSTGTLIVPMILHGAWDFMSFTGSSKAFKNPAELVDPRAFSVSMLALVVMAVLFLVGFRTAFPNNAETSSVVE